MLLGATVGFFGAIQFVPLADTVALGRAMIAFRARFTADAIRRAIAAHD